MDVATILINPPEAGRDPAAITLIAVSAATVVAVPSVLLIGLLALYQG